MATPLDIGLLRHFDILFPFLLVLAVVYGVLSYSKIFGEGKQAIYGIIAIVAAFLTLLSPIARETINMMAPWFILFFLFLVFLLVGIMLFGVREKDIVTYMWKDAQIVTWIIAIALIIGFGSLTTVISRHGGVGATPDNVSGVVQDGADSAAADQHSAFWATMVHPKVLGFILILIIAAFAINRISRVS